MPVCLCENGCVHGEKMEGENGPNTPAPAVPLSYIHFTLTVVCTGKLTQIQRSQNSKSCFVIKSFNILKCLNRRKHKNSGRKQKLMLDVPLTGISLRF